MSITYNLDSFFDRSQYEDILDKTLRSNISMFFYGYGHTLFISFSFNHSSANKANYKDKVFYSLAKSNDELGFCAFFYRLKNISSFKISFFLLIRQKVFTNMTLMMILIYILCFYKSFSLYLFPYFPLILIESF